MDAGLKTFNMGKSSTGTTWLCRFVSRIARPWIFGVLAAVCSIFVLVVFPYVSSEMDGSPLDVKLYYSADAAYELIESYGVEGRRFYARTELTVDVLYPIAYSLFFSVWLTLALGGSSLSPKKLCVVQSLPFFVLLFDLVENTGIVALLWAYPDRHDTLALATSLATSLKWGMAAVVVFMTLLASLFWFRRKLAAR